MGGFLHEPDQETIDDIVVSVPSRGMGGFLLWFMLVAVGLFGFRPLSRYGWFPTKLVKQYKQYKSERFPSPLEVWVVSY